MLALALGFGLGTLRPIVEPRLATLLCMAVSATRRPTRLAQHLMQRLPALVRECTGQSTTASRPMPH